MKFKHIIYILLVVILLGLVAYRISDNSKTGSASNQRQGSAAPVPVSGVVLEPQEFAENLSLTGSLEANETIEIRS